MIRMKRANFFMIITIFLIIISSTIHLGNGRSLKNDSSALDYGIEMKINDKNLIATTVTCEPTYGFLPCTTTLLGLLFMIIVYEVLLSFGERYISAGSDLFFETFGTGIIGSSIFHLLGVFPQVGLILVSGMASSSESVQDQVGISMGLLVGKTIMSLTLVWGLVVVFGSHDMSYPQESTSDNMNNFDEPNAKPFSLTGYGVTSDVETSHTARIMLASLIPFVILMFSKLFTSTFAIRVIVLICLIITLALISSYFIYQGFQPWIQERRLEFVLRQYIKRNLLQHLLTAGRRPNIPVIRKIFHAIDQNKNSYVSTSELKALILGIQVEETGLHDHDFVARVMEQFDESGDSRINEDEFVKRLSTWLIATKDDDIASVPKRKQKLFKNKEKKTNTAEEQQSLIARKEEGTKSHEYDQVWLNYVKAGLLIIFGTATTAILARPLTQSIAQFSITANIPSFLISYVVIPLALTFRQAQRAITSSKNKTEKDISLTLSEIYNGVFMVGLFIFLGLVYIQNLTFDVSAEVLVVVLMCLLIGLYTSFNTKFQFWTCIVAFVLYPVSLLFMYFLTAVLGWS